ncbi:hypothetical protein E2320_019976 [Naja naja]|nr:hypothetical protein E2320_019976 [Naja naja]
MPGQPCLVEKLRIRLKQLKVPVVFCQLDGSVAGGIPAIFITEAVELQIGAHTKTLSFKVAPGLERLLVLGLVWVLKQYHYVNWRKGLTSGPILKKQSKLAGPPGLRSHQMPGQPCLVEKLRIRLKQLKVPVVFCQLDGSVAGGIPAIFITEAVELQIGAHTKTLSFKVAPGLERLLVLGLVWVLKQYHYVNWRKGLLKI